MLKARVDEIWGTAKRLFLFLLLFPLMLQSAAADPARPADINTPSAIDLLHGIGPSIQITRLVKEDSLVRLTGNTHPVVANALATDLGAVDDALPMKRMILSLQPDAAQAAALDTFLQSTHDPSSPQYGKWLTPESFAAHFGVATSDILKVSSWLTSHGFTIDDAPAGGRAIVFSGTAAQVRTAFHAEIHRYSHRGALHFANASDPQIPAALSAVVAGVVSLHNFHSRPLSVHSAPNFSSGSSHYLAAADLATIYNIKPLYAQGIRGSGRSIAVLGKSNVVLSDISTFRTYMNLPANVPQITVNGADPGLVAGDQGESDLDLEWAGAVAPGATIKFITSADTSSSDGIVLSALYAVNHNVADVISISYGQCEQNMGSSAVSFFGNLWQQAVAAGITVVVSSGDSGAAGCDAANAPSATQATGINGFCSSPYSTCVGGSQFADTANPSLYWSSTNNALDHSSALSYIPEIVWNESGANGGSGLWSSGGGASLNYVKPSWQTTPGVPNDGRRDVPDVALTAASHDGYLTYSSDTGGKGRLLLVFGGTSAAAPSFAGIMALVNQFSGARQGNANVNLYRLASLQAGGGVDQYFHSIISGNNSVPGLTGFSASPSTPYFNQATGLGSVDASVLVNRWAVLSSQTITFINPGTKTLGMAPFALSATGGASGNPVTFASLTTNICTVSASTVTLVAVGTCTVAANQTGDATYSPAPQVLQSFAVTIAASGRLVNISTRMQVLTGNDVLIGGFIIGGSASKTVVVRARGPSLLANGITNALANPMLQLFSGATQIASNDNWQDAGNAATLLASGFAPANALESAIYTTLAPGAYTAIVTGVGGTTGVGIVEVFEVDKPEVPLINISARGQVLTGNDVMIGGFIIQGSGPQTVVVRARGPSLAANGITNPLANPMLQLFSGSTQIAINDNWQDAGNAATLLASGFAPANPLEAAILTTLNPGAYTVIVTGVGGTTGVGIVEVFAQ